MSSERGRRARIVQRLLQVLEIGSVALKPERATRSCACCPDLVQSERRYPVSDPSTARERAFCPLDFLPAWLTVLIDQIPKKFPEGFALFLFFENPGDITRHGIRSPCANFATDSGELFFR